MNTAVDSEGRALPPAEMPSGEKLQVYGDLMFLAFRSQRHRAMSVATLRTYLEPPIELGQFRVFRFDDVPRGMYTWAFMGPDAEARLVRGETLRPEDWNSGDRLWIIDLIAPYRGLTQSIARWIMKPGHFTDGEFLFRRVTGTNETRRIVHVDFREERLAQVMRAQDFLAALDD